MQKVTAEITFNVPDYVSRKHIEDWLKFEVHNICHIVDNPLIDEELEATSVYIKSVR